MAAPSYCTALRACRQMRRTMPGEPEQLIHRPRPQRRFGAKARCLVGYSSRAVQMPASNRGVVWAIATNVGSPIGMGASFRMRSNSAVAAEARGRSGESSGAPVAAKTSHSVLRRDRAAPAELHYLAGPSRGTRVVRSPASRSTGPSGRSQSKSLVREDLHMGPPHVQVRRQRI
jgi:hypothetical protein